MRPPCERRDGLHAILGLARDRALVALTLSGALLAGASLATQFLGH